MRLDVWGKGKGKIYDPCRRFVCSSFILQSRIDYLERRRAFRSGHPRPCVIDLLTRHVSAHFPLLPPSPRPRLSSTLLLPCMADSFSLLINDSSPVLSYFPFADTLTIPNFFEGWNPCFSISACPTFPGAQGNGSSFHVTSKDGAAFSIQWWGTPSYDFFCFQPSPSVFLQETAFNYPVSLKGPSHTTFSSTAVQIPPFRLPRRAKPYWRSMTAFSLVTTPCRSSSITPPTQHPH